jgi:hypothetical protein
MTSIKTVLQQFEPSLLDIEKQFEPILKEYGRILADYTVNTTAIENEIENIISTFFSNDKSIKRDLIEFLITNMRFQKKISTLKELLSQSKFKHLKSDISDTLEKIEKVVNKRNRLAHSIPIIHKQNDKFGYKRGKDSKKQPVFITKEESAKDKGILIGSLAQLIRLRFKIEKIKT